MNVFSLFYIALLFTCKTPTTNHLIVKRIDFGNPITKGTAFLGDTTILRIKSGFYLVIADTSKAEGFKLYNKDNYYFLKTSPAVTMAQVDSVYKDFDRYFNGYILIFKFNEGATKIWYEVTQKNIGLKVGLVLDNKLINVATIVSPISGGVSSLTGAYSESEIDDFLRIFKEEIKVAKQKND